MAGRTTPAAPVLLRAPLSSLSSSCCTPQLTRDRKGFLFWEIATAVAPTTDKRLTIIDPQRVTTASAPLHPETHTPTSPCRQKALVCLQGQACSLTISHEAQRPSGPRATMGVLHHASAYASTRWLAAHRFRSCPHTPAPLPSTPPTAPPLPLRSRLAAVPAAAAGAPPSRPDAAAGALPPPTRRMKYGGLISSFPRQTSSRSCSCICPQNLVDAEIAEQVVEERLLASRALHVALSSADELHGEGLLQR